ncbi:beta-lactamase class A [Clavibacter michiganensis]|uniref:class A beta-lactamase n=1 Tax=Clavibacter michiganensis TaxID=28447 RepID=UPI001DCBF27B|nr:class A beta-lactamase [Clavibacter michiganensis]MBP2456446.1 beta-lactamase class A [Clavibacter michiganensis]MDQ0409016.1 beta-lactamase class A [Clavibacter michiganensis]
MIHAARPARDAAARPVRRARIASLAPAAALATALLAGCAAPAAEAPTAPPASAAPSASTAPEVDRAAADAAFAALEERFGARLGVHAVDTGTGAEVSWRADELFAYASTVKAPLAAALLDRVGVAGMDRAVPIAAADILSYAPVTETRVGGTMTLRELAEAAMTRSDNTAANLLLEALGGPAELDAALTALGDDTTVVSRTEPDLNQAVPGDERDTTTPRAAAALLRAYALGDPGALADPLDADERALLTGWLQGTRTGATLVRAELPTGWTVGDKSGLGAYASRGDVAVIWRPDAAPIVIAVHSAKDQEDAEADDALISGAAKAAVQALGALD